MINSQNVLLFVIDGPRQNPQGGQIESAAIRPRRLSTHQRDDLSNNSEIEMAIPRRPKINVNNLMRQFIEAKLNHFGISRISSTIRRAIVIASMHDSII